MRTSFLAGLVLVGLLVITTACEGTDDSDPDVVVDQQSDVSGDFSCCINGDDYECDSSGASLDCLRGDFSGCDYVGDC